MTKLQDTLAHTKMMSFAAMMDESQQMACVLTTTTTTTYPFRCPLQETTHTPARSFTQERWREWQRV